jgi:hypothetical protein
MLGLSDARHFRRLVAGFCLIAAPAVLLVGALLHPTSNDDAAAHLAVVVDNPDRYYAAHAIILVGSRSSSRRSWGSCTCCSSG